MNLGVYGGTFDPIHRGHLEVARATREAHGLDRVLLMPAGRPPHKKRIRASSVDRLAMVRLAVEGEESFEISDLEISRGGVSYTVDSLESLANEHREAELFFILGADSLPELRGWRDLPRIFSLARIVVVNRPGFESDFPPADFPDISAEILERCRGDRVNMTPSTVSSSEVRERVRRGLRLDDLVQPAVARYIEEHRLYKEP